MPRLGKVPSIIGWVLSGLLAALLLFSATLKFLAPKEVLEGFAKYGLGDWRIVIGIGEVCSMLLFLVPRTGVLGLLLLSSYLGGAIVTHMQHGENFVVQSILLIVLWIAGGLRMPFLFDRLLGKQA
jgi:hypothetical protein